MVLQTVHSPSVEFCFWNDFAGITMWKLCRWSVFLSAHGVVMTFCSLSVQSMPWGEAECEVGMI